MDETTKNNTAKGTTTPGTSKKWLKTIVLYLTMVSVSTATIFFLEHTSIVNAVRTALVAAIGKTFAANWVSGIFD